MDKVINIMVVDDHQIVIDGIRSMLAQTAFCCVKSFAHSSEEAWEIISQQPEAYDLVITDISMKCETGTMLCRKIKNLQPRIKVLILTMYNRVDYVKEALACEADGYLLKNSGQAEFQKAIEALVDNGSYFSHEIVPLLYQEVKEQKVAALNVNLTHRETEVLDLILKEYTSKQIAEKLFISKQTVDSHRISLMEKTGSKSVVGLIKYALRNHLIDIN